MAHNSRVRANLTAWQAPGPIAAVELEEIDANQFASINGDAGGVWAPAAVIEIGGLGLLISGPLSVTGDAEFSGAVDFLDGALFEGSVSFTNNVIIGNSGADTLEVNATTAFDSPVEFNDPVQFDDTVTVAANLIIGTTGADTLEVNATVAFDSPVEFNDPVAFDDNIEWDGITLTGSVSTEAASVWTFGGDVLFNNDVTLGNNASDTITLAGTPTLVAPMAFSGDGRVPWRVYVLPDSSTTIDPTTTGNVWRATTLTANRTYTITGTNASGDFFWVVNQDSAQDAIIEAPAGPSLTVTPGHASLFVCHGTGLWTVLLSNLLATQFA